MRLACGHQFVACGYCGAPAEALSDAPPDASSDASTEARTGASATDARVFDFDSKKELPTTNPSPKEDPWWEQFWEVYPRKIGKKPAHRAWTQAIKNGASPGAIIDAARLYGLAAKRNGLDPKFLKYPQGWLNDERFNDELEQVQERTDPAFVKGTPEWDARVAAEEDAAIEAMQ